MFIKHDHPRAPPQPHVYLLDLIYVFCKSFSIGWGWGGGQDFTLGELGCVDQACHTLTLKMKRSKVKLSDAQGRKREK